MIDKNGANDENIHAHEMQYCFWAKFTSFFNDWWSA